MNRVFFDPDDPRFSDQARLLGVGHSEKMPPGLVSRGRGLAAYLLVAFHDEVEVELHGRRRRIPSETLLLWDRNRPHYFGNTARPWSHSWVVFDGEEWRSALRRLRPFFEQALPLAGREHVHTYFGNLLREVDSQGMPDRGIIVDNVGLILREFPRSEGRAAWKAPGSDPVGAACELVRLKLSEPLRVSQIARAAGLSASRLQQLFRTQLGCSIQEHVERERLREACYWLMHSGLRIGEIAHRVGYCDAFYFSRRFRRAMGQSPAQHRVTHYARRVPFLPRTDAPRRSRARAGFEMADGQPTTSEVKWGPLVSALQRNSLPKLGRRNAGGLHW